MPENQRGRPYLGTSQVVEKIKSCIIATTVTDCVVLIRGETGSGKSVAARWIHSHSARKDRKFVDINCAGLKGELLKSELFGHSKGSFTGAFGDRAGLIEEADGGTLFLDEIGDMDPSVQCLLLKAIEEKTLRRVGENGNRSSNFRLICATNCDLYEAIRNGKFRQDLFYRINTFTINIPPLRERREDISGLTAYLLAEMGYSLFPLDGAVVDILTRYPWPGNVRELRNTVERAMILAKGEPLAAAHFADLDNDNAMTIVSDRIKATTTEPRRADGAPIWNLKELEKRQILRAINNFNGDKHQICAALGVSMSTLYRKLDKILEKYQLDELMKGISGDGKR